MGKIIRRILTIIPAVALQSLWLLLLMKWLTPYAPIIVSLLSVAAFFLVVCITIIYIVLGNLPFIVVQRYNRPRLQKLFAMQQRKK